MGRFALIKDGSDDSGNPRAKLVKDQIDLCHYVRHGKKKFKLTPEQWEKKDKEYELYGFKVSEKNLETLSEDAPESIKNIKLYRMYTSRVNELKQWIEGATEHDDNRLRGSIIHLGSWSGRASHSNPNTANIAGVQYDNEGNPIKGEKGNYGYECRSLWTVDKGKVLVGCDASGIQLRILAHYLNHPEYTKAVLTDIHTFNANILGTTRPNAKTFIYSWLLGAGVAKTAEILDCSIDEAHHKREQFEKLTPGLSDFMKEKTTAANRGWFRGMDGRKVYVPSDHLALTGYLQNGEHVCMAMANIFWDKWATNEGLNFKQVSYVHDEHSVEVDPTQADRLMYLMEQSYPATSDYLKLNCPLAGEAQQGLTWADVH